MNAQLDSDGPTDETTPFTDALVGDTLTVETMGPGATVTLTLARDVPSPP